MAASVEGSYDVGFVGAGRIASLLEDDPRREKPATHAGAVDRHPRLRTAGVYDRNKERGLAFADRWGAANYATADELLINEKPQLLVVATHPDSHERYVRLAARHGVAVVICEKPVAHTLASARRIAGLERRGSIRVVVNHERRFSQDYRMAREAVVDRRYGELIAVSARLFFGSRGRHDHVMLHDGTHLIDAINFLTGDTVRFRRRFGRYRSRRRSAFLYGGLRRRSLPVTLEIGAQRRYLLFEVLLSFSDGEVRLGNGEFAVSRAVESPFYSGYRSLQSDQRRVPEPTGYFEGMVAEAVRLLDDATAVSESSAQDGLAVMRELHRLRGL
jgi:predicted dehydrogenase